MKPLKRFFLYCFYCTVAYFTKGHSAYGAYRTSEYVNSRNVYSNTSIAGCKSYVVPGYNEIEGTEAGACGSTGASHMTYKPAVSCTALSKDSDGVCTLSKCSWDCEIGCPKQYWGKTMLYHELESSTCTEDLGPACPVGDTFHSLYYVSWCNSCPTSDAYKDKVCPGGETFKCIDYEDQESVENYKTNNCDIICSSVPGAYTCDGDQVTDCKSGYYEVADSCSECRPWEICPQGDDDGGVLGCKVNDSSYTGEAYTGTGTGISGYIYGPYYMLDNGCHACPDNAECDQETFSMTCNDGYYRERSSMTWSGVGALGGEISRKYDTYVCKACTGNAATCDEDGALSCKTNYYLVGKECVKCPDNATCHDNGTWVCNDGFYKSNGGCEACPTNYESCTDEGFTCKAGYFSNGTACPACKDAFDNAITCTAVAATSCYAGYYLKAGQCAACPTNSTCTSDTNFTCNNGFYKSNGACVSCPANYETCNNNGFTCKGGFYKSDNECIKCTGNATTCDENGALLCNAGYYLISDQGVKKCQVCPAEATCPGGTATFKCNEGSFKVGNACSLCGEGMCCSDGGFVRCKYTMADDDCSGSGTIYEDENATGVAYYGDANGCYKCPDYAICNANATTGVCMTGFFGIVSGTGASCTKCPDVVSGTRAGQSVQGSKTIGDCYAYADPGSAYTYTDNYGEFYFKSTTVITTEQTGSGYSNFTGAVCFWTSTNE